MEINRVIEVDIDTNRKPSILIRIVKQCPHREGIIPHEKDSRADVIVLTNGLLAAILKSEEDGTYGKGEAMKKVIENLQEGYVDASVEITDTRYSEDGKKLSD